MVVGIKDRIRLGQALRIISGVDVDSFLFPGMCQPVHLNTAEEQTHGEEGDGKLFDGQRIAELFPHAKDPVLNHFTCGVQLPFHDAAWKD